MFKVFESCIKGDKKILISGPRVILESQQKIGIQKRPNKEDLVARRSGQKPLIVLWFPREAHTFALRGYLDWQDLMEGKFGKGFNKGSSHLNLSCRYSFQKLSVVLGLLEVNG